MKKVKLLIILMCVLACLSGCTIDGDTVATITGNEAAKTKTTCRLKEKGNIQTKIVLKHNGEEINDEFVKGEIVWLDYFASYDSTIEEQNTIINYIDKNYPNKYEYLFDFTNFIEGSEYASNGGVAGRTMSLGTFDDFRDSQERIDYFKLTPELLKKETMTYQDFIVHLENIGYECK